MADDSPISSDPEADGEIEGIYLIPNGLLKETNENIHLENIRQVVALNQPNPVGRYAVTSAPGNTYAQVQAFMEARAEHDAERDLLLNEADKLPVDEYSDNSTAATIEL